MDDSHAITTVPRPPKMVLSFEHYLYAETAHSIVFIASRFLIMVLSSVKAELSIIYTVPANITEID